MLDVEIVTQVWTMSVQYEVLKTKLLYTETTTTTTDSTIIIRFVTSKQIFSPKIQKLH